MPKRFTLLTRPGCHLCEVLEAEALSLFGDRIAVDTVLIDHHPAWQAQYGLHIPVLLDAEGELVCAVQLDAAALSRRLEHLP